MEATVRWIGIDLGKRSMVIHTIGAGNKHDSWSCLTDAQGRERLLKKLLAGDVIAMEACPLAFILESMIRKRIGSTVQVLNPLGLAMIYRSTKKTDREDAAKLAWVVHRLPESELPQVTVPSEQEQEQEQELRYLVSEQVELTQSRTREINRLHALFVQAGITTVTKKDLRLDTARQAHDQQLVPGFLERARRLDRIIAALEQNLEEVETKLKALVAGHELTPFLMSIPGVGPNLAATFLGFLGNAERFQRKTIASYAGLVPRVDCSGDKNHYGPITKRGNNLFRRALVQGAWGLVRSSHGGVVQKKYLQWKDAKGKSKAIVALARKLVETMWVLATRKALYLDLDPVTYKRKLEFYGINQRGVAGIA